MTHDLDVVPDTTEPWRYYPLAVGNEWEYYRCDYFYEGTTECGSRLLLRIVGETVIDGTHYFLRRGWHQDADGNQTGPSGPLPIRFDSTEALVMIRPDPDEPEEPFPFFWPGWDCPLDLPFGSTCERHHYVYEVYGGYDRSFIFGGPTPHTGPDTISTATKGFWDDDWASLDNQLEFAADIGVLLQAGKWWSSTLYYARIYGKSYGQSWFLPVGMEDQTDATDHAGLTITAWPNPARAVVNVVIELTEGSNVRIDLYDLQGRLVAVLNERVREAGSTELQLNMGHYPAGLYILRATGNDVATRSVIILP